MGPAVGRTLTTVQEAGPLATIGVFSEDEAGAVAVAAAGAAVGDNPLCGLQAVIKIPVKAIRMIILYNFKFSYLSIRVMKARVEHPAFPYNEGHECRLYL